MTRAVIVGVRLGDVRLHVPLRQLQALLNKPAFECGQIFVEVWLVGVTPPAILVALDGYALDQLNFFRHDYSLAAPTTGLCA